LGRVGRRPRGRKAAAAGESVEVTLGHVQYRVRYVAPSAEEYQRYYNIVANPMLWFIQHYLWIWVVTPTSAKMRSTPGVWVISRSTACS